MNKKKGMKNIPFLQLMESKLAIILTTINQIYLYFSKFFCKIGLKSPQIHFHQYLSF